MVKNFGAVVIVATTLVFGGVPTAQADADPPILYSCEQGENLQLCVQDATGERVLTTQASPAIGAEWSPDGAFVAFVCNWSRDSAFDAFPSRDLIDFGLSGFARNAGGELCVVGADGSDEGVLTDTGGYVEAPAWSPDGTKIVYATTDTPITVDVGSKTTEKPPPLGLFVADLSAGKLKTLVKSEEPLDFPAWSPDGRRVAYADSSGHLWTVATRGGTPTRVSPKAAKNAGAVDVAPAWSPDGSRIAFTRVLDGVAQTWIMDANGTHARILGRGDLPDANFALGLTPRWSPDGQSIAITYLDPNQEAPFERVAVLDVDGGPVRYASPETGPPDVVGALLPRWSADGASLVFQSDIDGGAFEVYRAAPDGSGLARLTDDDAEQFDPVPAPT